MIEDLFTPGITHAMCGILTSLFMLLLCLVSIVLARSEINYSAREYDCQSFDRRHAEYVSSKSVVFECFTTDLIGEVLGSLIGAVVIALSTNRSLRIHCASLEEYFEGVSKYGFSSHRPQENEESLVAGSGAVALYYHQVDWKVPLPDALLSSTTIYFRPSRDSQLSSYAHLSVPPCDRQYRTIWQELLRPSPSLMSGRVNLINGSAILLSDALYTLGFGDHTEGGMYSVAVHVAVPHSLRHVVDVAHQISYTAQFLRKTKLFLARVRSGDALNGINVANRRLRLVVSTNAADRIGIFRRLSALCRSLVDDMWMVDTGPLNGEDSGAGETIWDWLLQVHTDNAMPPSAGARYSGFAASTHALRGLVGIPAHGRIS